MRLWWAILTVGMAMTGGAQASSFVAVAPPEQTPSVVVLGSWQTNAKAREAVEAAGRQAAMEPAGATVPTKPDFQVRLAYPLPKSPEASAPSIVFLSPSIVAFDPPVPSVTFEQVAAIAPAPPRKQFAQGDPVVIRGGIVGGSSAGAPLVTLPKSDTKAAAGDAKAPTAGGPETTINAAGKKVVVISAERARKALPEQPMPKPAPAGGAGDHQTRSPQ